MCVVIAERYRMVQSFSRLRSAKAQILADSRVYSRPNHSVSISVQSGLVQAVAEKSDLTFPSKATVQI